MPLVNDGPQLCLMNPWAKITNMIQKGAHTPCQLSHRSCYRSCVAPTQTAKDSSCLKHSPSSVSSVLLLLLLWTMFYLFILIDDSVEVIPSKIVFVLNREPISGTIDVQQRSRRYSFLHDSSDHLPVSVASRISIADLSAWRRLRSTSSVLTQQLLHVRVQMVIKSFILQLQTSLGIEAVLFCFECVRRSFLFTRSPCFL